MADKRTRSLRILALLLVLGRSIPVASAQVPVIDTTTLPHLLEKLDFTPPEKFKALVVEITLEEEGERKSVAKERWFDWRGTSLQTDWNAASTVKLYAAVAALRAIAERQVSPDAKVSFEGISDPGESQTVANLVRLAIVPSDNIAFNRLVILAGYDYVHKDFLQNLLGIRTTALNLSYASSQWVRLGGQPILHDSPTVLLKGRRHKCTVPEQEQAGCRSQCDCPEGRHGKHCRTRCERRCARCPQSVTIPARQGNPVSVCENPLSSCTTLADLAECMRRLVLQEELENAAAQAGQEPKLRLLPDYTYWKIIVRALKGYGRKRGNNVQRGLRYGFHPRNISTYNKPGFANKWMSDVVYILEPHSNRRWIVAMAGWPGRSSLDKASRLIGRILSSGALARAPHAGNGE